MQKVDHHDYLFSWVGGGVPLFTTGIEADETGEAGSSSWHLPSYSYPASSPKPAPEYSAELGKEHQMAVRTRMGGGGVDCVNTIFPAPR